MKKLTKEQAAVINYKKYKQEGGVSLDANEQDPNYYNTAPQKPVARIIPVQTSEMKEGSLQPGSYQKVEYFDGSVDYLTPSGFEAFKKMTNGQVYFNSLKPQPPISNGNNMAVLQEGDWYKNNPFIGNNYQLPTVNSVDYNAGVNIDPNNMNQQTYIPNQGMQNRMAQNKVVNSKPMYDKNMGAFHDNYDENGNAIDTTSEYNDNTRLQLYNPFGGVGLDESLYYAGQGYGEGDAGKAAVGTGLSLLKGARNFLSGYSTAKENRSVKDEMYRRQFENNTRPEYLAQQGGDIKTSEALTGQFITNNPNGGNVEVEGGEHVKNMNTGDIQEVVGDKHASGGVTTELDNAKILSDYTKIGATNAKELKKKYDLATKATDTFATVMDKYNKKIGVKKEIEEQASLIEKLGDNEAVKQEATKRLNEQILAKQIEEKEQKLQELKPKTDVVFEDLFKLQEQIPKLGRGNEILDSKGNPIEVNDRNTQQQGGHVYELAKKYGISPERAMELMQEGGGVQSQQEEQVEGNQSNGQEENKELDPQQIMQMVTQALQQGVNPQEIAQKLVQMGIPQDQVVQILQQVMGQSQQNEQVVAQGGGLVYNITNGRNEYVKNPRVGQHAGTGEQAYGEPKPEVALQMLYNNFPDIVGEQFKDNIDIDKQGNIKFKNNISFNKQQQLVGNFQRLADERMKDSSATIINNPTNFNVEQVKEAQRYSQDETFMSDAPTGKDNEANSVRGYDQKLGNFTSGRYSLGLDLVTPEDYKLLQENGIKTVKQFNASSLKDKLSKDSLANIQKINTLIGDSNSDYTIGQITKGKVASTDVNVDLGYNNNVKNRDVVKKVFPNLPVDFVLPPSAMQTPYKAEVSLGRIDPVKISPEESLVEQERQRKQAANGLASSNLSPQLEQALLAQQLGNSQMASNEAIGKAAVYNAQNQFQVDQFNIGQRTKEDLSNEQFNLNYEGKVAKTEANQERDLRRYFNELNLNQRRDFKDVNDINLANAMFDQFQSDGSGVQFMNNKAGNLGLDNITQAQLDAMTPQQKYDFMTQRAAMLKNAYLSKTAKSQTS